MIRHVAGYRLAHIITGVFHQLSISMIRYINHNMVPISRDVRHRIAYAAGGPSPLQDGASTGSEEEEAPGAEIDAPRWCRNGTRWSGDVGA